MKRDLRKQTFSKPAKPSDEEIRLLSGDEEEDTPPKAMPQTKKPIRRKAVKLQASEEFATIEKAVGDTETKNEPKPVETAASVNSSNPFLLSRGQTSDIQVEKNGYRLRSDFKNLLKLVKRMKKERTLEAVLDDAFQFYFENSEDGRKAVKQRQMRDSDDD